MWNKTINLVANQLDDIIHDYDVSLIVAKLYVQLRIEDSTKISRNFHYDRLIYKLNNRSPTIINSPSILISSRINHFGTSTCGPHSNTRIKHSQFYTILRYLQSKRGFHQHYWSVYRSAWSIPYNPNEIITLKDKLNDLNQLSETIITSHAFQTFDWLADV